MFYRFRYSVLFSFLCNKSHSKNTNEDENRRHTVDCILTTTFLFYRSSRRSLWQNRSRVITGVTFGIAIVIINVGCFSACITNIAIAVAIVRIFMSVYRSRRAATVTVGITVIFICVFYRCGFTANITAFIASVIIYVQWCYSELTANVTVCITIVRIRMGSQRGSSAKSTHFTILITVTDIDMGNTFRKSALTTLITEII